MVAVALYELRQMVHPQFREMSAACTNILVIPLVIQFVNNEYAQFIAQTEARLRIGIMLSTHVVHPPLFHHLQAFLYCTRIGRSTKSSERMMIGISLEQHLLSVE